MRFDPGVLVVRKVRGDLCWKASLFAQRHWYFGDTPADAIAKACAAYAAECGPDADARWREFLPEPRVALPVLPPLPAAPTATTEGTPS